MPRCQSVPCDAGGCCIKLPQRPTGSLFAGGASEPWFVTHKDAETNFVYVCRGPDHPALATRSVLTEAANWIAGVPPAEIAPESSSAERCGGEGRVSCEQPSTDGLLRCEARVRHLSRTVGCRVSLAGEGDSLNASEAGGGRLCVRFDAPARHVAEQQALVLYDGDVCLGGAGILSRDNAHTAQHPQSRIQPLRSKG